MAIWGTAIPVLRWLPLAWRTGAAAARATEAEWRSGAAGPRWRGGGAS